MSDAPICDGDSRDGTIFPTQRNAITPFPNGLSQFQPFEAPFGPGLPFIPKAHDLQSVINAVNAMRKYIHSLHSQKARARPAKKQTKPQKKQPRWEEANRVSQIVRVYNPHDKTQWVDVERINAVTMKNTVTGEIWEWSRQQSTGGV